VILSMKKTTGLLAKAAALKDSIERKGRVGVQIRNNEFYPTIVEGDMAVVTYENPQNLMIGDVVLLVTKADIIVRRVQKIMRFRENIEFLVASNKPQDVGKFSADHLLGRIMDVTRGTEKVKFDIDITLSNFLLLDVRILLARLFRRNGSRTRNALNRSKCLRLQEDSGYFVA
jgi:hypothetical protein